MDSKTFLKAYKDGRRTFDGENLRNLGYISGESLNHCQFIGADLRCANILSVSLRSCRLIDANLENAYFENTDLSYSDLSGANLKGTKFKSVKLSGVDFSGAKGLISPVDWLRKNLRSTSDGWITYKIFGLVRNAPKYWNIKPGAVLKETCNPDRPTDCGSGINLGTRGYILNNLQYSVDKLEIWEVLIPWKAAAGIVVPFTTDGKIRCSEAKLLKRISYEQLKRRKK